ncbi:MAG: hypothetical protein ACO1OF_23190, partial [Adhaeribacter sp.]
MKKFILPLILFLVTLFSCTEEKNVAPQAKNSWLIKEIKALSGKTATRFVYDASGKILETESLNYYNKFYYNQQGDLIKQENAIDPNSFSSSTLNQRTELMTAANAEISSYTLYEFNPNNQLITAKYYQKQNNAFIYTSRRSFEYTDSLITRVNIHDATDRITQYNTFSYDSSGNVSKEHYYSSPNQSAGATPQLIHTVTFLYDTKNNPFRIYRKLGLPGLYTNPNNIIEVQTTSFTNTPGIPQSSTAKNTYEYNAVDYPVKENSA